MAVKIIDIAVIGGGPAGISACLELSRNDPDGRIKVVLFDSEKELGGIPRSCHVFFGMRDLRRVYSGPAYAQKLRDLIRKASVEIHTGSTVLGIAPDPSGRNHTITVSSSSGVKDYCCRFIVLATGCYEKSRESRRIPGSRPAGIYTTGTLQQWVNIDRRKPGNSAVIIGSEHVSFSSALTLRRAGISIEGLIEENRQLDTYPLPAKTFSSWLGFPIYKNHIVKSIMGKKRPEAVEVENAATGKTFRIPCDTVICTGKFRPDASLIYDTIIEEDFGSSGPVVDAGYMTSVPNIFAAGNVLHGAEMHDICALEGRRVACNIIEILEGGKGNPQPSIELKAQFPIRFVVPQRIDPQKAKDVKTSLFNPGVSFQAAFTVKKPIIEVWSKAERIWSRNYPRLIGNSRILLPVEKFDWHRVDLLEPLWIRLRES